MKKLLLVGIVALMGSTFLQAVTPKHEHRAAWVATVYRLDWPTSYGTTTTVANKQKQEADAFISSLATNNYNAVYFQVRPRADAMYNSAYEPWSSDLTGSRGSTPAWDPLAYWVQQCHANGLECYAWLNPYRYESSAGAWGNSDYRKDHSDWIMEYNGATILNPGIEGVKQRICDVVYDIMSKYDIDGVVFDDYFYLSGTPMSYDSALYSASGSSLSQADWRRENVNEMVRRVYQTIQSYKPWVKFIIGPAGAGHAPAAKYGLSSPNCSASDWQYASLYSEPLAWLYEGTIDAISPQLYWSTTHSTNPFGPLTQWWSYAAETFGRHNYPSQSISSFSSDNSTTAWNDHITMTELTRQYAADQTAGTVLWSASYATGRKASGYAEYTKQEVFDHPALQPAINWKMSVSDPGTVGNLALSGSSLTWDGFSNYRYAVYAVPTSVGKIYTIPVDYLIGNPFSNSFTVPSTYLSGYNIAVSAVDRCGNEFTPIYVGDSSSQQQLDPVTLTSPSSGASVDKDAGFTFAWSSISGASYTIELSTSASFNAGLQTKATSSSSLASTNFTLAYSTTYYWRVIAAKSGYLSSTSAIGSFTTAARPAGSLPKDPSSYSSIDGYSIESLWLYSVNTSNFPSELAGDHRAFAYLDGKLYVSTRADGVGSLLEFNATDGTYLRTINLSGDYSTLSTGSSLGYVCNDVFTDSNGHLCVSNMCTSISTSSQLTVCTVNLTTGATTRIFQSSLDAASMRLDYMSAIGDVTASGGVLYAATTASGSENQNRVYRFTRGTGSTWTTAYTTIGGWYPTNAVSNGTGARVTAISSSRFILDGGGSNATFYDFVAGGTATMRGNFEQNTAIKPVDVYGNGACIGSVNGSPLFAYSYGDRNAGYQIGLSTLPDQTNFANSTHLWAVPAETLGTETNGSTSSQPIIVSNSDNTATLYIYTPANGIGAYKITKSASTPDLDAVTLSAPADGSTTGSSFNFSWSAISGATYTIEISRSQNFTSLFASKSNLSTNTVASSEFNFDEGTTYYWRVKAEKSGYNSSQSVVRSFTTPVVPTLNAVALTSPDNGASVESSFNFTWEAISGATYTLEISRLSTFATILYTTTTSSTSVASSAFNFDSSTTYYWRVRAAKAGYHDSTSEIRSFVTPAPVVVLPKDPATYSDSNGFSIESLWLYSLNNNNFPSELAGDHRGFAYLNGKLYVSTRADGAGSLLEYDAQTLQLSRTIALTGDYLTLSDGTTLQFPCNDVFVDGAGHLCVSSMSITFDSTSQLTVCTVNVTTGATTRVFQSNLSATARVDFMSAYGDVTASGGVLYCSTGAGGSAYTNRVYRFTRGSSSWTTAYTDIASYYPTTTSNNGYGSRAVAVSASQFILDGSASAATLYTFVANGNATMSANFSQNTNIAPVNNWGNGACVASIGGTQLIAYAYDSRSTGSQFAIATYPNNSSFASSNLMWTLPTATLGSTTNGYSSTQPILVDNGDGTGYLYIYAPLNGIGAYKITNNNYTPPLPDLDTVVLIAPTDGEQTAEGFNFSWNAISGATYTIEISTSSSFASVAFTSTTSATSINSGVFNLNESTTYYWRVRANKEGYNESVSTVRSFRTADPVIPDLSAVTLSAPAAGATVDQAAGFNFSWSAITGATYTIELSKSSAFTTLIGSQSTSSNSIASSNFSLEASTTYYWRVRAAKSGYNSSVSASRSFTTSATPDLAAVNLTSPAQGARLEDDFNFTWSAIAGATYTLEISATSTMRNISYTTTTTATSVNSSQFGLANGTYYWRVRANKSGYNESVSVIRNFTLTEPEQPVIVDNRPKDPATYAESGNLIIDSEWHYTLINGNLLSALEGDNMRGMAALDGKVYVIQRIDNDGMAVYLKEFDAFSCEHLRDIYLSGDCYTLEDGTSLGYPGNDVFTDGAGHLCVSNMAVSFSGTSQLTVCTVNLSTGATTRIFQSNITATMRIDYMSAYGDVTNGGYLFGATSGVGSSNKDYIYRWQRNGTGSWTQNYTRLRSYYPAQSGTGGGPNRSYNNGAGGRVLPITESSFIFDSNTSYPTLYSFSNGSRIYLSDSFQNNTALRPNGLAAAGMCTAQLTTPENPAPVNLFIYASDDQESDLFRFNIVRNPSNFSFSSMSSAWTVPTAGMGKTGSGYITTQPAALNRADGSVLLFMYVPKNGLISYHIYDPSCQYNTDVEKVIENGGFEIRYNGEEVSTTDTADIAIYTTAGALAVLKNGVQNVNVGNLSAGVYIVKAVSESHTATRTIIVR